MPDGQVIVREAGQEVVVDAPSLSGEIGVDLDSGPSGDAEINVPTGTTTVHDEEMDPVDDGSEDARPDGGAPAAPRERVQIRGTGLSQHWALWTGIGGLLCILWAAAATGGPSFSGIAAGLGLAFIGAKNYFTSSATGGDQ